MSNPTDHANVAFALSFFQKAFPDPQSKNFHTQFGVHLEEVAETLEAVTGTNDITRGMILRTVASLVSLSKHLKSMDNVIIIKDPEEFLDGLCDQLVTAVGTAHMAGMDIIGAFGEVNRSNLSKFDDNGNPILDSNLKLVKGPGYFKPNLKPFIENPLAQSVSPSHVGSVE